MGHDEGQDYLDRVGLMARLSTGKADVITVEGKYVPVVISDSGALIGRVLMKPDSNDREVFGIAFAQSNELIRDVKPGEIWVVDVNGLFRI